MLNNEIKEKKSFIRKDKFLAIISQKKLESTRVNTQNPQLNL